MLTAQVGGIARALAERDREDHTRLRKLRARQR
jgi:hypothetical protein